MGFAKLAQKADLLGEDGRIRPLNGEKEVLDAFSAFKKASGQWGVVTEIRGRPMPWRTLLWNLSWIVTGPLVAQPEAARDRTQVAPRRRQCG